MRFDIAYVVSMVSQFMHNLKEKHPQVVHEIQHYLKGTPRKRILFKKGRRLKLKAQKNAYHVETMVYGYSISSYCAFLDGNIFLKKLSWLKLGNMEE